MAILQLTTLDRLKARGATTGSTQDALLTRFIAQASQWIEEWLDRGLMLEERTEELHVQRFQRTYWLRCSPVTDIESVKLASDWDFPNTDALEDADFHLSAETGELILADAPGFTERRAMQVVYTGGLAANTTNLIANYPDIAEACDVQAMWLWQRRADHGKTSKSQGSFNANFQSTTGLIADVQEMLAHRKRYVAV